MKKTYMCIDFKSFFASVECVERKLNSLTTNLVVADPSRGDGAICLAVSPALKAAGVKTIILSLNDVDDAATYTLMVTFYNYLIKGYSKREAFKKARKALRDSEEFKSFNYWTNFVMLD